MKRFALCAAVAGFCASSALVHAQAVTYQETATITGSIGAISFTDAAATFTFQGDASGTTSLGAGFYTNTDGISTVEISGIGTAIFLDSGYGVESEQDTAGFFDINTGFGVSLYDPNLGPYDLSAPFSDTGYFETSFAASSGTTELTSLGELSVTGDDNTSTTFTATAVPEPALSGALLVGSLLIARRRKPVNG